MKISKAIIACAGYGTRFLPITKTIQKEMLPILNRPLIDYIVEDCANAGIEEIIFVVKEGHDMVRDYYTRFDQLQQYLEKMHKLERFERFTQPRKNLTFKFVTQKLSEQYGTAVPVRLAHDYVKNEDAFLVFMGDDFVFNSDGTSETQAMIELFRKSNSSALATCINKEPESLHKYGIAALRTDTNNGCQYLLRLVEKPQPGTAPSTLANISKYIFTQKVFSVIENQQPDPESNELYITDTITTLAQQDQVVIHTPTGEYLDGGDPIGWLRANLIVGLHHPDYKKPLAELLKHVNKN